MSKFDKNKQNNEPELPQDGELYDPLNGIKVEEIPQEPKPEDDKTRIVRIEKLEKKITEDKAEEIDSGNVVSLYMPRRRAKRLGLLLLRLDKLRLGLIALAALIAILFLFAFMQERMGNFTINLNRLELFRKGIAIADDYLFTTPTASLSATVLHDATNTTLEYLPENLDEIDGDHNGRDYVAYTYYIRNGGKVDVGYVAQLVLQKATKGAEYATRVAVWRNGERIIYAEPAADGSDEEGCVSFESHDVVCTYRVPDFLVGYVDKYTVVIWLEGEDPECVDRIVGGSLQFAMNINADDDDESSLLSKFVRDVRESVAGEDPINADGTTAPEYYLNNPINWENRRNQ